MKRTRLAAAVAAALLIPALAAPAAGAESDSAENGTAPTESAPTYTVTYRNLTEGQYQTPPVFVAHDRDVSVFRRNRSASPGVQAVAENGNVPALVAELQAAVDDQGLGLTGVGADAPIPPGGEVTFEFTTDEPRLSIVSMLICTNDGFAGLNTWQLPLKDDQTKRTRLRAYDAGTEINTELRADLVPAPFCGEGEGSGESDPELAENGRIRIHRTIRGVGDLGPEFDWKGRVAEIVVTRNDPAPTYTITVENMTGGQYLTPPNVAIHERSVDVFSRGSAASPAVQAVAENGGVPVLAGALKAAIDDAGLGASTVGGDGPIAPGESATFQLTADGNRLSMVSMLICTNDGFAGIDSKRFNLKEGQTRSFRVRAYDAGTEINTERYTDLVPAPFCGGDGVGTGETNPELAENGVIRRHRTIRGVGDLGPEFDWKGPVATVTITRNYSN